MLDEHREAAAQSFDAADKVCQRQEVIRPCAPSSPAVVGGCCFHGCATASMVAIYRRKVMAGSSHVGRAQAAEGTTLFADAAKAKPAFHAVVKALADLDTSVTLTQEVAGVARSDGSIATGLKRTRRIVEKAAMRRDGKVVTANRAARTTGTARSLHSCQVSHGLERTCLI